MSKVDNNSEAVEKEIKIFQKHFKASLKSKIPFLDIVARYIIRYKGSHIRPKLVFLSAKLTGKIKEQTYSAASIIELLHSATLIHQDVSDEPYKQINHFSINSLWSSKIAVLMGDYLLAKGLLLAVQTQTYDLLEIISQTIKEMNEVEISLSQINPYEIISPEVYFSLVCKRNALLISVCSEAGSKSVNADKMQTECLKNFGYHFGIALQIKEDLKSIRTKNLFWSNKKNFNQYKYNLPLIYAIENSGGIEKEMISKKLNSEKTYSIRMLHEFILKYEGEKAAIKKINLYKINAINSLDNFPDTALKQTIIRFVEDELIDYQIN